MVLGLRLRERDENFGCGLVQVDSMMVVNSV